MEEHIVTHSYSRGYHVYYRPRGRKRKVRAILDTDDEEGDEGTEKLKKLKFHATFTEVIQRVNDHSKLIKELQDSLLE